MLVLSRRNTCFEKLHQKGVNGLKNHITQIPIGTSTSNMIHDTPLITKTPRPSKGRAPSFNQQFLDFPPFVALIFRGYVAGRQGGGQHPRTLRLHCPDGGGAVVFTDAEVVWPRWEKLDVSETIGNPNDRLVGCLEHFFNNIMYEIILPID